ncbi:MAG TPA: hypothetical protein VIM10_18875 [Actinopolymorphaceae bacterium]|jgi:hypothetical protein
MSRLQRLRDPVFLLVGPAVAWGILLLVLAGTVPVVTPQSPPGTGSAAVTSSGTVVTTTTPSTGPTVSGQARITLVRDSGHRVLGLVALPTVAALIVGLLLWRQARIRTASVGSTTTSVAAWVLSAVVLLGRDRRLRDHRHRLRRRADRSPAAARVHTGRRVRRVRVRTRPSGRSVRRGCVRGWER